MDKSKRRSGFLAISYKLKPAQNGQAANLEIVGQKFGPPSKRISLNQKGLKVTAASIVMRQKKGKEIDYQLARINHLPTFEEVRLHTVSPLYPGYYKINLKFKGGQTDGLLKLPNSDLKRAAWRQYFPSTDDPEARQLATLEIT